MFDAPSCNCCRKGSVASVFTVSSKMPDVRHKLPKKALCNEIKLKQKKSQTRSKANY